MRVAGRGINVSGREASQCPSRKVLLSVLHARSGLEAKEDWPVMFADPHYLARTTGGPQHSICCPHLVDSRDRSTAA